MLNNKRPRAYKQETDKLWNFCSQLKMFCPSIGISAEHADGHQEHITVAFYKLGFSHRTNMTVSMNQSQLLN